MTLAAAKQAVNGLIFDVAQGLKMWKACGWKYAQGS